MNAKNRAKKNGRDFLIGLKDIVIPQRCPILNIPLQTGSLEKANSPSLDRIDNTKGYVPGNVAVISFKANTLKNNGTLEELEAIVNWLKARLLP